jgi:Cu/Ag efflux protein CusF
MISEVFFSMRRTLALALLLLTGCSKLSSVDVGVGTGRGIVRRIDFEHHLITLEHGPVTNLLNPMTYSYAVRSDSLMKPFAEGDTVAFTMMEKPPGQFVVLSLKKIHGRFRGAR